MEAQAIALISRKQAAAALLGGDADGGGLAQLSGGSNSLLAELARAVAEDERVVDATQLFRHQAEQSVDFTSGWAANIAATKAIRPEPAPLAVELPTEIATVYVAYRQVKQRFPQALVLLPVDECYVAFDEDAQVLSRELGSALAERQLREQRVPVAGFPREAVDSHVARLIQSGHQVAVAGPSGAGQLPGLTPREVVQVPAPTSQPKTHTNSSKPVNGKAGSLSPQLKPGGDPRAKNARQDEPLTPDQAYYAELADRPMAAITDVAREERDGQPALA